DTAVDLAWGVTGERGSLIAGINYAEGGTVNMASRAPCGLIESGGKLVCSGSSATIGGRALLADGARINFRQNPGDPLFETYNAAKHNYNGNP
ncbi:TonB-dependent receptor, partial [Mycobacterium tuberculosis]